MKTWWICLPLLILLAGCGGPKDFETMGDSYLIPTTPEPARVSILLPEDAVVMTMQNETGGTLYLCDGYSLAVQTLEAGDLDATLRSVTGYGKDALRLYTLQTGSGLRHECVWAAVGEDGDQVGKAMILDDGAYHYAVTVLAQAERAGELAETWQEILDSIELVR